MKCFSFLGIAVLMEIAVIAAPAMAAPVDLRSTMQNDHSQMIAVPVFTFVNTDIGAVQVSLRSSASPAPATLDLGHAKFASYAVATGLEVTGLIGGSIS